MVGHLLHGRYRVGPVLGGGGMALVYSGTDERLGRPVAVKVLADNLAADTAAHRRFLREGRLASKLSHPGIVAVYDSGREDGRPFIVMELVAGRTLADVLRDRGMLAPEEAAAIGASLASALAHAHAAGLVHRDVKPPNVLVDERGRVKLVDFGIARLTADATRMTEVGTVLGTAAYVAPEQIEGQDAGPPADVYGLGVLLYELLTGVPPYPADTLAELAQQRRGGLRPPSELAPGVPAALDDLVERCLARDPRERPTADEVADSLRGEAPTSVLSGAAAPTQILRRRRRPRLRRVVAASVAAAALAALVAALVVPTGENAAPPSPPTVAPVPRADTPAEQARALARWVERHSR